MVTVIPGLGERFLVRLLRLASAAQRQGNVDHDIDLSGFSRRCAAIDAAS